MISFFSSQGALTRSVMVEHAPALARRTEPQSMSDRADTAIHRGCPLAEMHRYHAIRELAEQSDHFHDIYAETGCFAALGDAHRVDAQLDKLLGE